MLLRLESWGGHPWADLAGEVILHTAAAGGPQLDAVSQLG